LAIPTWTVGEVLASADVNNWFVPRCVVKPSDTSRASNTTFSNDPALLLPFEANSVFQFTAGIDYEADATGDFKFQWTVPAGASMLYLFSAYTPADNITLNGGNGASSPFTIGGAGAGTRRALLCTGVVTIGSTAGNLAFQWAQAASSATAAIVHAQSYLTAFRVG
jgi:hypothetical protein